MKNSLLKVSLVAGLGLMSVVPPVQASTINQMEQKKQEVQQKKSKVNSGINQAEQTIKSLQGKQATTAEKIQILTDAINETTAQIDKKNVEIKEVKAELAQLKKEITIIKKRMAQREELLKERARSMQQSGGNADYLEVILGSKSFGDFLERVNAVATIMDADQEILRQQEEDKKKLEQSQQQAEDKAVSLQNMLNDLKAMKAKQKGQVVELSRLMKQLKHKEEETHSHQMDLKEQEELLSAQESSIQQAINLEKTRQAELAAARKRAAEEAKQRAAEAAKQQAAEAARQKAAQAAAQAEQRAKSSSASEPKRTYKSAPKETYHAPEPAPSPAVSSGNFTRPAAGALSSNYGARWGTKHMGVDIAARGYVPVMSAADGVVSRAYTSSSYGNVVFVSHSINGQVYTTVYAHMQSFSVSTGQVVAKGQQIGVMGNTGQSTGQHLHFELHRGEWNAAKSNAVNPIGIVPF
ncbi:murein hydrolase activator EnvC family protein [Peribacillus sp. SCS-26]|uniref:murein hydrolase activator EnvC family protein n=1 Tax=Paraperibacillus marinus TaxID=3115295 RepID=UPI0039062DD9